MYPFNRYPFDIKRNAGDIGILLPPRTILMSTTTGAYITRHHNLVSSELVLNDI